MVKNTEAGKWAFTLGVLIAIVVGLFVAFIGTLDPNIAAAVAILLVGFGLLVGFLNIGHKEMNTFLLAAIAFLAVGAANLGALPVIGGPLAMILSYLAVFVAPAALVVALKAIWELGKNPAA